MNPAHPAQPLPRTSVKRSRANARRPRRRSLAGHARTVSFLLIAVLACGRAGAQDGDGVANDRAALGALYEATRGDDWNDSGNWLTDRPLSQWHGVTTDAQGRVTELALVDNNLKGPLPDEIGELNRLTELVLIFNELSGEIPASLGELTELAFLDLQWNTLSGPVPPELGSLAKLRHVVLATNQLTGRIPAELANLPALRLLTLNNNDLTGPIPSALGDAPAIEILSLGGNSLSGDVPASLSNLDLRYLDLDFNRDLSGPLPPGLEQLSALRHLSIHGTSVCVPTDSQYRRRLERLPRFDSSGIDCGVAPATRSIVDVAVFFTPAAREAAGGTAAVEAAIDLMAAETNQAYADSGVEQRIALAAVEEVRYRESGNSIRDLFRLNDPADGHLDGVHVVRDLTGADLVQLLVGKGTFCGVANSVPRAELALGVTLLDCGGLTFAHEVGHGMGLVHDRYVECAGSPTCTVSDHYPYSFGYVNPRGLGSGAPASSRWATIMAYLDRCADAGVSCRRLARFSNPLRSHRGDPLGQAGDRDAASVDGPADAVRALNDVRHSVAAFRDRVRFVGDDSPQAVGTLPDVTLQLGDPPLVVDAAKAFRDPNGDRLTFAATSSGVAARGRPVARADTTAPRSDVTISPVASGRTVITITATDTEGSNTSAWQQFNLTVDEAGAVDYDADGDRLIEIRTLAQLDAVRHDLDGDGRPDDRARYAAAFPNAGLSMGCNGPCDGYELATDLDLDTSGNGRADAGDDYWNAGRGWRPLRRRLRPFDAVFEGNGHTIANLFIDREGDAALFGRIGRGGVVRHLGLTAVDVTGSGAGGLAIDNDGVIHGTYVTGRVAGEWAGALTLSNGGRVSASYGAARIVSDQGGGLLAWNVGWIGASYATGSVTGSGGGLVAVNDGVIVATYATGEVSRNGGALVLRGDGEVRHSYWDADASGLATSAGGTGRSTASLQAPTGYTGVYARWNLDVDRDGRADDPWDFGTTTEYPVLVLDFDRDGNAGWEEFGDQRGPVPRLEAATVVDDWLILTFSKDLEATSIPPPTDFVVRVDGVPVRVDAVEVEGRDVRLRLAEAPFEDQEVTVSYTPGANPIRGVAGPLAPALDRRPAIVKSATPRSFWRGWRWLLPGEDQD